MRYLRPIVQNLRLAAELNGQFSPAFHPESSTLVGLLWDHRKITYDAGVRFGLTKDVPDIAFTSGLTFRF